MAGVPTDSGDPPAPHRRPPAPHAHTAGSSDSLAGGPVAGSTAIPIPRRKAPAPLLSTLLACSAESGFLAEDPPLTPCHRYPGLMSPADWLPPALGPGPTPTTGWPGGGLPHGPPSLPDSVLSTPGTVLIRRGPAGPGGLAPQTPRLATLPPGPGHGPAAGEPLFMRMHHLRVLETPDLAFGRAPAILPHPAADEDALSPRPPPGASLSDLPSSLLAFPPAVLERAAAPADDPTPRCPGCRAARRASLDACAPPAGPGSPAPGPQPEAAAGYDDDGFPMPDPLAARTGGGGGGGGGGGLSRSHSAWSDLGSPSVSRFSSPNHLLGDMTLSDESDLDLLQRGLLLSPAAGLATPFGARPGGVSAGSSVGRTLLCSPGAPAGVFPLNDPPSPGSLGPAGGRLFDEWSSSPEPAPAPAPAGGDGPRAVPGDPGPELMLHPGAMADGPPGPADLMLHPALSPKRPLCTACHSADLPAPADAYTTLTGTPISKSTAQKVLAAKAYFATQYSQQLQYATRRHERRAALEEVMSENHFTEEQRAELRLRLQHYETRMLRLARRRPKVSEYRFLRQIGRGAYGRVFLAVDESLDQQGADPSGEGGTPNICAIKRIPKPRLGDESQVSALIAEKQILSSLSHSPWHVRLHGTFQDDRYLYFAMEFVPGGDLRGLLEALGCLEHAHAATYAAEMVSAVSALHAHGFFHRDVKPENFLISAAGHLKLTDFGLCSVATVDGYVREMEQRLAARPARSPGHARTVSLTPMAVREMATPLTLRSSRWGPAGRTSFSLVGSPNYMAPELLQRGAGYDYLVDYWAIGCIFFELIYGFPPFTAPSPEEIFDKVVRFSGRLSPADFSVDSANEEDPDAGPVGLFVDASEADALDSVRAQRARWVAMLQAGGPNPLGCEPSAPADAGPDAWEADWLEELHNRLEAVRAWQLIHALVALPEERLGRGKAGLLALHALPLFADMDFGKLLDAEPLFVPQLAGPLDTSYFTAPAGEETDLSGQGLLGEGHAATSAPGHGPPASPPAQAPLTPQGGQHRKVIASFNTMVWERRGVGGPAGSGSSRDLWAGVPAAAGAAQLDAQPGGSAAAIPGESDLLARAISLGDLIGSDSELFRVPDQGAPMGVAAAGAAPLPAATTPDTAKPPRKQARHSSSPSSSDNNDDEGGDATDNGNHAGGASPLAGGSSPR
ncbi:AGC/NDR/NDR-UNCLASSIFIED protein kinase [Fonticula alba]|uniref:non-specific serine/threonine protein kinase n=1 Tax=Fonticula alba TaxID=691883 RepID=A0A058ZCB0_FONAL|nr:AGC/NDR/NDR-UNCLASSIFIED protein kinase [Fonticula alba]KCV72045.1 AGC/NDR/NDR-UNCLASSIFIED protein kinase [Fonticula alba]|eukprot:XP_009493623.1 AGC/NDR/NDR-UNCLASSIFIED protein kinase [Fonticula alba]